ncbi:MAG TPA: glycoside hydrolase domain-containing protein [Candidatus Sulfotelmatobacter sp.]
MSVAQSQSAFLGFDRNEYPGDSNLKLLKQTFSYAGYWLNNPPGASKNTWAGHRPAVESAGFGFLVLFNGRLYAQLKTEARAQILGRSDAAAAVASARREGFPEKTIIFLDQEQGGRMLPEQKAYIYAWVDGVTAAGFRAGVYCSGQPAPDDDNVVTAVDIQEHSGEVAPEENVHRSLRARRDITYWVVNDACPPSPGCSFRPPSPARSGVSFAEVWQFAQSPQREDVAAHCTNYSRGNCYAPGVAARGLYVDLNAANSADPSHARTR